VCVSCGLPSGLVVIGFAAGSDHTMFLVSDTLRGGPPILYGLGSNRFGQLGSPHAMTVSSPVEMYHAATGCAASARASDWGVCGSQLMEYTGVFAGCDQTFASTTRPKCPPGSFGAGGVIPCAPCPAGYINKGWGQEECSPCPQGQRGYVGGVACEPCPAGTDTAGVGAGEGGCRQICGPGTYGTLNTTGEGPGGNATGLAPCVECEFDTYSSGYGAAGACTPCPDGKGARVRGMTNTSLCRSGCSPGSYSLDGFSQSGECTLCTPGKAQPNFRGTGCVTCAAGTYSLDGADRCIPCSAGTYGSASLATACLLCDYGTFSDTPGATVCTSCAVTASTRTLASNSSSACASVTYRDFAFGRNSFGQLGFDNEFAPETPQPVLFANDVGNPGGSLGNEVVLEVNAGFSHTVALTGSADGGGNRSVWAVGTNEKGELGMEPDDSDR